MPKKGFFKVEKKKKPVTTQHKKKIKIPRDPCRVCGLHKTCKSPKMEVHGNGRKKILLLGQAPGRHEDENNRQWVGQAGTLLRKRLSEFGIEMNRDCYKDNCICCRPPDNRTPTDYEIALCRQRLLDNIKKIKPDKIFVFGREALQSLIGEKIRDVKTIGKWIGWKIPDQELKTWIYPLWHPSYILRNAPKKYETSAVDTIFNKQLQAAIMHNEPFPDYGNESEKVTVCTDLEQTKKLLRAFNSCDRIAIDYETTGIKPDKEGHEIICMAISAGNNSALAFPIFDDKEFKELLKRILTRANIQKIAHNLKFEAIWTRACFGYWIKGWIWDSMLAAHFLDNRGGITGLKFQNYVRYGLAGYGEEIEPFMKGEDEKNSNCFNRIKEFSIEKTLLYCGIDAMTTYRLAHDQMKEKIEAEIEEGAPVGGMSLLIDGARELAYIEANGIHIDTEYYQKQEQHLARRIERLKKRIDGSEEALLWKEVTGQKLNFNSGVQLGRLLYDRKMLGYKPIKMTAGKKPRPSTDKEALEKINNQFVKNVLQYKRLHKLKDTYLIGFIRETVNDYMRPNYNLHIADSFRSSSSNPNFQNIPNRDDEAKKLTRAGIIPRPGHVLLEVDYSGAEVRGSACNNHDPVLIDDICNKDSDMHRDTAIDLFKFTREEWEEIDTKKRKAIRQTAKNRFVFAEFYGDYFANVSQTLWDDANSLMVDDELTLIEHLETKGIRSYRAFEKHVERVENKFWNERFKVYRDWKEEIWKNYKETGYVDLLSGFRCREVLKKNKVLNRPIQGFSFHFTLWSLIQINRTLRREKWNSKIIGQIHDAIVFDVDPAELEELKKLVRKVMCEDIREHWPCIIVPLDIEADITEVDGNWYEKKEIKI